MRSFNEGEPGAGLTIDRELFTHADEVARLHRDVFAIPPSTSVAAQPSGFDVRLASGDQVHVPYEPDWDAIELPLSVTARLYLYTARFLPLLLESEHTERAEALVSGYFAWIRRKSSKRASTPGTMPRPGVSRSPGGSEPPPSFGPDVL